jgi:hypothetical protein
MGDAPRSLAELLASGSLGQLSREAERRRAVTAQVRELLPPDEASHLVSAALNEAGDLVLVMDTPVWAARARYCTAGLPSERVRIKVVPRS